LNKTKVEKAAHFLQKEVSSLPVLLHSSKHKQLSLILEHETIALCLSWKDLKVEYKSLKLKSPLVFWIFQLCSFFHGISNAFSRSSTL